MNMAQIQDVSKTEARNVELKATIRTLQRKIYLLENEVNLPSSKPTSSNTAYNRHDRPSPTSAYEPTMSPTPSSAQMGAPSKSYTNANDLAVDIHHRVTQFVLNRVARQLSHMEMIDNEYFPLNGTSVGHLNSQCSQQIHGVQGSIHSLGTRNEPLQENGIKPTNMNLAGSHLSAHARPPPTQMPNKNLSSTTDYCKIRLNIFYYIKT